MNRAQLVTTFFAVVAVAAGVGLPVRAHIEDQRRALARNDAELASLHAFFASAPERAALESDEARARTDLAIIDRVTRAQAGQPKLMRGVLDAIDASGVTLIEWHGIGGNVELCASAPDNTEISAMLRALQAMPGVHDVSMAFIERDWQRWCFDKAPPGTYGALVFVKLNDAEAATAP